MPYPAECINTYSQARACFEGVEVTTVPKTVRFGGESMTKQCFHNTDYPWWVCLIVTESKKRLLEAEVEQLIALGKELPIPYLGPGTTVEELIFPCKRKGQQGYGFMQMMFGKGFIETKVQNDESGNWLYDGVLRALQSAEELASVKLFIAALEGWVAEEDIPDLQVAFDPRTRALYVFDPGDPQNWGSLQSKHLGVIRRWKGLAQNYRPRGGFASSSATASVAIPQLVVPSQQVAVPSQQVEVVRSVVSPKLTGKVSVIPKPVPEVLTRVSPPKAQVAQLVSVEQPRPPSPRAVGSSQNVVPSAVGPREHKCGKCGATFASYFLLMQHRFDTQHV